MKFYDTLLGLKGGKEMLSRIAINSDFMGLFGEILFAPIEKSHFNTMLAMVYLGLGRAFTKVDSINTSGETTYSHELFYDRHE